MGPRVISYWTSEAKKNIMSPAIAAALILTAKVIFVKKTPRKS
jgi:hypothetical protein